MAAVSWASGKNKVMAVEDRRSGTKFLAATLAPKWWRSTPALRLAKCHQLMAEGVTIFYPQTCVIDTDVEIGADTVIEPFVQLLGNTRVGSDCRIRSYSVIHDSEIDDRRAHPARLRDRRFSVRSSALASAVLAPAPGSEIGEGAHVGNFVETKKTRLGKGSKANHLTYLGDAEIGEGVNIGAGTITCNYDGVHKHTHRHRRWRLRGQRFHPGRAAKIGKGAYVGAGFLHHRRCSGGFPRPGPRPADRKRRLDETKARGQGQSRKDLRLGYASAAPLNAATASSSVSNIRNSDSVLVISNSRNTRSFTPLNATRRPAFWRVM